MEAAIRSSGPVSLEAVFEEGVAAADALERGALERLDEPAYQKVQSMMAGFWVTRFEIVIAAPDATYFLRHHQDLLLNLRNRKARPLRLAGRKRR
jgi:hypothetical protein